MSPGSGPAGPLRLFRFPWRSRAQIADEIEEELDVHIDHVAGELRRGGWTAADAHAEAVRRFGDLTRPAPIAGPRTCAANGTHEG